MSRDRDAAGRPRNARRRDSLGRPLDRLPGTTAAADEPPLPPADALQRAQEMLDAGEAFRAHEVLEAVWKATDGSERELWRGLAQLCVGITHVQRGNRKGAAALFSRAADNLREYDGQPYGVPIRQLVTWADSAVADPPTAPPQLTAPTAQAADERA